MSKNNQWTYTNMQRKKIVDMLMSGEYTHKEISNMTGVGSATLTRWKGKCHDIEFASDKAEGILPESHFIKGLSTNIKGDGTITQQWVKTTRDMQHLRETVDATILGMIDDFPKIKPIAKPKNVHNDLAVVIPIGDAHIGMYSWAKETGEDFNLEIAKRDLCTAFDYLIDQGPSCERAIIANVGDFFHYHAMEAKTEKHGNMLDASGRPQEMVQAGVTALRYCIEKAAKKHGKVEVINVSGNHDGLIAYSLSVMLKHIYEKDSRIIIHDSPSSRHYIQHGKVLIGVVHGHQTKDKDLAALMAAEQPEKWGKTQHRVWFRGHHHHDSRVEYIGAVVEQIRTLAPNDAYASNGGYLSGRDIKQIIYHKEYGEWGRAICGIDLIRALQKKA